MRASVNAVLHNIPAMLVWSALILVLTIIGYTTLLLGLLYIAPLLGHATWHCVQGHDSLMLAGLDAFDQAPLTEGLAPRRSRGPPGSLRIARERPR